MTDIIYSPFCLFLGWKLELNENITQLYFISKIKDNKDGKNKFITFNKEKGSIDIVKVMQFLCEKWHIIARDYKTIKNADLSMQIVDFEELSENFNFQIILRK